MFSYRCVYSRMDIEWGAEHMSFTVYFNMVADLGHMNFFFK